MSSSTQLPMPPFPPTTTHTHPPSTTNTTTASPARSLHAHSWDRSRSSQQPPHAASTAPASRSVPFARSSLPASVDSLTGSAPRGTPPVPLPQQQQQQAGAPPPPASLTSSASVPRRLPDTYRGLNVDVQQQHQHQHQQASSPLPSGFAASDPALKAAQAGADVMAVGGGANAQKKDSLNFVVMIISEFVQLYGPVIILLENLHEFDTWSWQLLTKIAEVLTPYVLVLATTRPNKPPVTSSAPHHLHGKAALLQKVAVMYRHLLKLPTTSVVHLEPFNYRQTEALMKVVSGEPFPESYVLAVMDKTGGMPLYTEKVTEFLCQRPWLTDQGGEIAANVNKMIRNLNFQQVIIERMDRLKPGVHLTLKVASVMGQWVDLDILHRFYPINKSKDELRGHLVELERGNFLKPTDTEGVWEFNMVERDIVYEVIPHYQRRRLHAKLAQELEHTLEEYHVATLTTIAYHWNQACMGNEVTEVECALKAIEHWHRAAEAAYSGSLLMEALRLYQKAGQIAEVLGESMGDSQHGGIHESKAWGGRDSLDENSMEEGRNETVRGENSSFIVGSTYRGQLNWSLISRIMRAQWEKAMASCCLGIVLQHRYESHAQLEVWETQDYFQMLTEHAIRGLMLLGTPDPYTVLAGDTEKQNPVAKFFCCCFGVQEDLTGWESGVELQDQEITEIRDILLVLIIAAEHYSLQHNGEEYIRLLTFCKCVCKFLMKCAGTGEEPFQDIYSACLSRIKHFKANGPLTPNSAPYIAMPEPSLLPVREEAVSEYAPHYWGWEGMDSGQDAAEMVAANREGASAFIESGQ